MTNSSRYNYNESLACEAFISGKQGNRKYYVSLSKTYGATSRDRSKYPTLQNRNIYIYCAHLACFLSVICASDSAKINCYERAQAKGDMFEKFLKFM